MENTSFESRMQVRNPEVLQLYSFPTPNGIKVAAALEEIKDLRCDMDEIFYEPHAVNIRAGESRLEWFKEKGFPNQKVPGIVDPCPDCSGHDSCCSSNSSSTSSFNNHPISVFESGNILRYLGEKYKMLIPLEDELLHTQTMNWLFYGSTTVSTQFKAFGFYFKFCSHALPYCVDRQTREVHCILQQLEDQLHRHTKNYIVGDAYTIADLSMWPWVEALTENFDNAGQTVFHLSQLYPRVNTWYLRCAQRPASIRAKEVCNLNFESK